MRIFVGVSLSLLLVAGCHSGKPQAISAGRQNSGVIESSQTDPKTGNLIAWWMIRGQGKSKGERVAVLVEHPYAIFIQWPNEKWNPNSEDKRLFVFYDNVAHKSYRTTDFDTFLEIVRKQPEDIKMILYDTCSVLRNYMPQANRNRLEAVLAEGKRTWGINPCEGAGTRHVCYCSCEWDFVFPEGCP